MSHHEIYCPKIGRIRGLRNSEDIVQFLGVRYANVKDRFSRGVLCEYAQGPNGLLDATKIGSDAYFDSLNFARPLELSASK